MKTEAQDARRQPSELGDFQTPETLASEVWRAVAVQGVDLVIEPTVGQGIFLATAPDHLVSKSWRCFDTSEAYIDHTRAVVARRGFPVACAEVKSAFDLRPADFRDLGRDTCALAIGNPPWVTNAAQGSRGSANVPLKWNRFGLRGLDALTGRSNFDIAEAILLALMDALRDLAEVRFAFLLKRSVAMKLTRDLAGSPGFSSFSFARIDAAKHFDASVEAGLFQLRYRRDSTRRAQDIEIARSLGGPVAVRAGLVEGMWVEDVDGYAELRNLEALAGSPVQWRQGVKHDAARVLELREDAEGLVNGLDERVNIERGSLCPLYKSSDLAAGRSAGRWFPLYQTDLRGPHHDLRQKWPRLAAYLDQHRNLLDARKSRIYEGKPPFMLFGVGDYTVAPYKVAVSGLYKTPQFRVLRPVDDAPPLVDDTCYMLPYWDEAEAVAVADFLNSRSVQRFLACIAPREAKRPYTKEILSRIRFPQFSGQGELQRTLLDAAADGHETAA
jgi:hypothetical protein